MMNPLKDLPDLPYLSHLGYYFRFVHEGHPEGEANGRFSLKFSAGLHNPIDPDTIRPQGLFKPKFMDLKTKWRGEVGFMSGNWI